MLRVQLYFVFIEIVSKILCQYFYIIMLFYYFVFDHLIISNGKYNTNGSFYMLYFPECWVNIAHFPHD